MRGELRGVSMLGGESAATSGSASYVHQDPGIGDYSTSAVYLSVVMLVGRRGRVGALVWVACGLLGTLLGRQQ